MKRVWLVGFACLTLFWSVPAHAARAGLTVKGGTLGIGADVTASLAPRLNVRGNFNVFKYSFSGTQSEVRYDVDIKLRSFAVLLDLHPVPRSGFRLSGGVLFNKNRLDMVSDQLTGTYTIGSKVYTVGQVGTLNGEGQFKTGAPYLSIGWGNATGRRVGFAFDLGVAFQGSPDVSLRATGPIANDSNFLAEMNQEVQSVRDDLPKAFNYYPVFSLGITFKLGP
jgi:hypothetical protein